MSLVSSLEPVDTLIERVMKCYPGMGPSAQLRYFEAVHQELAPLARMLELENQRLRQQLADQKIAKFDLLETVRKRLDDANALLNQIQEGLPRGTACPSCSPIYALLDAHTQRVRPAKS